MNKQVIEKNETLILNIQKFSTEDGPGIRTTVFFKGCPLRCKWCHNPESFTKTAEVEWHEERCIHCGICLSTCNYGNIKKDGLKIIINKDNCRGCGLCSKNCPGNAIQILGKKYNIKDLFNELIKDKVYYDKSGGGVTASGGEPTLHPDFIKELFMLLKNKGINTALDTCGLCNINNLKTLLPYTDIVLFDIKTFDREEHLRLTGSYNDKIIENLFFINNYIKKNKNLSLWIRTPLIPDATATKENILQIGDLIKNINFTKWELCAFNNLCKDKYKRLGLEWEYDNKKLFTKNELNKFEEYAKSTGIDPCKIIVTGTTKIND